MAILEKNSKLKTLPAKKAKQKPREKTLIEKEFEHIDDFIGSLELHGDGTFEHCCGVGDISCNDLLEVAKDYPELIVAAISVILGETNQTTEELGDIDALVERVTGDEPNKWAAVVLTDTKPHPILDLLTDTIPLGQNNFGEGNPLYMWIIRRVDLPELAERFKGYGKFKKVKK